MWKIWGIHSRLYYFNSMQRCTKYTNLGGVFCFVLLLWLLNGFPAELLPGRFYMSEQVSSVV